jgi:hypothetical protein
LADRVDRWFLSWNLLPEAADQVAFRETNFTYLAALCWPAGDRRTLFDLARLAICLTRRDSEWDAGRAGDPAAVRASIAASIADTRAHYEPTPFHEPRWAPPIASVWSSLARHCSPALMGRLADAIVGYLSACLASCRRNDAGDVPAYLTHRRGTVAQRVDHVLTEISLGIELPKEWLTHPLLTRLLDIDVDRTVLLQDVLSLRKELADGEAENIVLVIAGSRPGSLSDAEAAAVAMYEDLMDAYDAANAELLAALGDTFPRIHAYAQALNDFNAGVIAWTSGTSYYTGAASCWEPPEVTVRPV